MTEYTINSTGAVVPAKDGAQSILITMTADEFRENRSDFSFHREMLHSLGSIRYCKAELYKNCIIGTMRVPRKEAQRAPELCFGFCLTDKTLHIIEDTGEYKTLIARLVKHSSGAARPSQLLLRLLGAFDGKRRAVHDAHRNGSLSAWRMSLAKSRATISSAA